MSNRTLLEINHDLGAIIERDPEGFAAAIGMLLRSGNPNRALERFGVSVGPTRHHSDPEPFKPRDPSP